MPSSVLYVQADSRALPEGLEESGQVTEREQSAGYLLWETPLIPPLMALVTVTGTYTSVVEKYDRTYEKYDRI